MGNQIMFTGIVEDAGKITRIEHKGQEKRLTLELPSHLTELQLGDSLNINGVCLTVVQKNEQRIEVDLSLETLQKTTLSELKEGDQVNLERALRLSDRLGGHIVTGHVDGIGEIAESREGRGFLQLKIRIPESVSRYVVQKGSIAIDGISLTVNEFQEGEIQVTLIPYTIEKTTLMRKRVGDRVNLEGDILGKYVEKFLSRGDQKTGRVGLNFLKEHGFIKGE
ncbi:MAG TPA: riboflavin synthase [Thermodesulfobacteriota bacterium]|nr:riboflavin synthase [Thermodesulfobacteriota bacterium]